MTTVGEFLDSLPEMCVGGCTARAEERAAIVAFLRRGTDRMVDIAGRIERGEHVGVNESFQGLQATTVNPAKPPGVHAEPPGICNHGHLENRNLGCPAPSKGPCISGAGRTDGHMVYASVEPDGHFRCAFCNRRDDEPAPSIEAPGPDREKERE